MKYNDGLYHVEFLEYKYGQVAGETYELWGIVTVWGEFCIGCDLKPIFFYSKVEADDYCDKLNICQEGATCRNFC